MKILLTAINAKYIHSNLAVYSLKAYAREFDGQVELAEYTINQRADFILQQLYKRKPDVICFSCYIWNISYVRELARELHKLSPGLAVWVGGPEVSCQCQAFLEEHPMVTGIMRGEGEGTFLELCRYYVNQIGDLENIPGLVYRNEEGEIRKTPDRKPLSMDELPFCYDQAEDFENRIIYYETSRGCPFGCSYCLSSVEKSLRFRSLSLVKKELAFFLEHRVRQVKFVDRTFNCNHHHALEIWRFLKENDNGKTNFHFEISADLLKEEELALLSSLRPGLVQLEIGVQTVNPKALEEIHRSTDLKKLADNVLLLKEKGNIHQHLDLIAGLPYEDYESFAHSFDAVYRLHPQQLQLGFLKVLKGSGLYEKQKSYCLLYRSEPPYEVLKTAWLSYEEILQIKNVEEMLEVYYNSGQFEMTMQILELAFESPFEMFQSLGQFYESHGLFQRNHSRISRCEILLDFVEEWDMAHLSLYQEALTFDLYLRENMKSRPFWAPDTALFKEISREVCRKGRDSHLEPFHYDFTGLLDKKQKGYPAFSPVWQFYLFSYQERDRLTGQAKVGLLEEEEQ